jgi:hypothetical protein
MTDDPKTNPRVRLVNQICANVGLRERVSDEVPFFRKRELIHLETWTRLKSEEGGRAEEEATQG